MRIITGGAALCTAAERWGTARALDGRGPGRHPFAFADKRAMEDVKAHRIPVDVLPCDLCRLTRGNAIHQAPKRRKVAAFVKNVTLTPPAGPGNTGR